MIGARLPASWPVLAAATTVLALQVAPGSPCAHACLGSGSDNNWSAEASNTNSSEITCSDAAYSNTRVGIKYKECQECLRTSTRGNWGETDAKWFIYNLRYALDVCLFDSPQAADDATVSPCASNKNCKNLQTALTGDDLVPTQNLTWSYCFMDDGAFMGSDRTACMQCLRATQDQTYMANFFTALEAGCRQTPDKGTAIGLSGTVFTSQHVNITDPDTPSPAEHGSLSTAAVVGIAVSVIIVSLVGIGLLLYYCHKEKVRGSWDEYYFDAYAPGPRQRPPPRGAMQQPHYNQNQTPQQLDQVKDMAEAPRPIFLRNNPRHADDKTKTTIPNGDNYGMVEHGLCNTSANSYPMKELSSSTAVRSTGTLHSSYSARSISRGRSRNGAAAENMSPPTRQRHIDREVSPPSPSPPPNNRRRCETSPPASAHNHVRSNTPDSFAEQAYMDAAAESARLGATAALAANSPPVASSGSPGSSKRRSMLSMLSHPKRNLSRKGSDAASHHRKHLLQPPLTKGKAFRGDRNISRPILSKEEPCFLDPDAFTNVSVTSRAPRAPTPHEQDKYA